MLVQFTVENFKSIRDEITLDMQSTGISELKDHLIYNNDETFLPIAAIYGPNGSGKSNVIQSLHSLRSKIILPVLNLLGEDNKIHFVSPRITPFAFSKEKKNEPTKFEIYFRTELAEYEYKLYVLNDVVVYELLNRVKFETNYPSSLFERNTDEIHFKGEFRSFKKHNEISDKVPLLSVLMITYAENETVKDIFKWFINGLEVINYGAASRENRIELEMLKDLSLKKILISLLNEMDINIDDIEVVENEEDRKPRIYTIHKGLDYTGRLELKEESSGTRKLLSLLLPIIQSITNGSTLVIDELDAKLHPLLTKHIIEMYTNKQINTKGAQLIFTSHDVVSLNNETFRRDEIWFVAKGSEENSILYSLVEFKVGNEKVRNDATYNKQYLEGKYGADPYLQRLINWSNPYGEE